MNNLSHFANMITTCRQLFIFIVVGGSAFLTHLITVYLLVSHHILSPLIANIFGFLLSFNVSFCGHYFLTFSGNNANISRAMRRLFLVASVNFVINEYFYYILLKILQLNYLTALVINLSLLAVITFFVSKYWIFRQEKIA